MPRTSRSMASCLPLRKGSSLSTECPSPNVSHGAYIPSGFFTLWKQFGGHVACMIVLFTLACLNLKPERCTLHWLSGRAHPERFGTCLRPSPLQ